MVLMVWCVSRLINTMLSTTPSSTVPGVCVCVWATCEWVVARQNTTCDEPWLTTGLWCGTTLATITITMCLLVWLPCWSTACLCVCVMAKAWWLVLHFVVAWWPCGCPVCVCCCWLVALGVWVWLNSGTWLWCCTLCHHVASLGDCCLCTVIVVVLVTRLFGQPFPHHLLCPHPPLSFLLHPRLSLSLCVRHEWWLDGCGNTVAMMPNTGHLAHTHTQDSKTTPW